MISKVSCSLDDAMTPRLYDSMTGGVSVSPASSPHRPRKHRPAETRPARAALLAAAAAGAVESIAVAGGVTCRVWLRPGGGSGTAPVAEVRRRGGVRSAMAPQ